MNISADFSKITQQTKTVWKQFCKAFPVIVFFLVLFAFTIAAFGIQYTIIPSLITVNFRIGGTKGSRCAACSA